MGELFQPMHLIVIVLCGVVGLSPIAGPLVVVPCWQIFKRAGFPGQLALLMMVPVVGLVVLYVVAFSRWRFEPPAYYSGTQPQAPPVG